MNWRIGIPSRRELWTVAEIRVSTAGLCLSLVWEFLQSPLYTDAFEVPWGELVYNRVHCSLGDVLILLASFWIIAVFRGRTWLATARWSERAAFSILGLAYTLVSEYVNVSVRGTWAYTLWMPTIAGIGVAPILQWIVIPLAITLSAQRRHRTLA